MVTQGNDLTSLVLAAGKGTRMKSRRPKVLHEIAGLSMLGHVLATADACGGGIKIVVVGPDMDDVADEARRLAQGARIAVQARQAGTGDAVAAALPSLEGVAGDVVILYGDTPLVRPQTIAAMRAARAAGAGIVVLGFRPKDPGAYGRVIGTETGGMLAVERIVEAIEASPDELAVRWCNSGIFVIGAALLRDLVPKIGNDNAKGEFYLTDIVALARAAGHAVVAIEGAESEVLGINSRVELAGAEALYQARAREAAMLGGATLIDPPTVYFSHDTLLGRDVSVGPNVFFGPGVTVEDDVEIRANCHIEGARIAGGAVVGPFARLRPGADIGPGAHIGNFVEVKKAVIEAGAKVNHLTYIGDARVGAKANIGAGTITCNYDGYDKHFTDIGAGAFIGSNSSLVAPVTIGDGAYIGSGSIIARDVDADALALTRPEQAAREGWAARFHARKQAEKRNKSKPKE